MRLGVTFTGDVPIPEQRRLAYELESAGLESLWTNDGYGRDPLLLCQAWADATERLTVGVGVAQIPTRTPVQLAKAAVTVQEASAGRFVLGIGVSQPLALESWHGVRAGRPLATAHDALAILHSIIAGGTTDHDGDELRSRGFQLGISPLPPPVPVYLGAMRPKMLALAGREAEGVLLSWESPEAVGHASEQVYAAAAAAGRPKPEVAAYVRISIAPDRRDARRALASEVAEFWKYYANHIASQAPDPAAMSAAHAAAQDGPEALAAALSDELLMTVGWYGSTDDDLGPLLARYRSAGLEHFIARPITSGDSRVAFREVTAALASEAGRVPSLRGSPSSQPE